MVCMERPALWRIRGFERILPWGVEYSTTGHLLLCCSSSQGKILHLKETPLQHLIVFFDQLHFRNLVVFPTASPLQKPVVFMERPALWRIRGFERILPWGVEYSTTGLLLLWSSSSQSEELLPPYKLNQHQAHHNN